MSNKNKFNFLTIEAQITRIIEGKFVFLRFYEWDFIVDIRLHNLLLIHKTKCIFLIIVIIFIIEVT